MLWSLWIIYILFAENFKAKINTNIFRYKTFISSMVSKKLCLHVIHNLLEWVHTSTLLLAPFRIDKAEHFASLNVCSCSYSAG